LCYGPSSEKRGNGLPLPCGGWSSCRFFPSGLAMLFSQYAALNHSFWTTTFPQHIPRSLFVLLWLALFQMRSSKDLVQQHPKSPPNSFFPIAISETTPPPFSSMKVATILCLARGPCSHFLRACIHPFIPRYSPGKSCAFSLSLVSLSLPKGFSRRGRVLHPYNSFDFFFCFLPESSLCRAKSP